MGDTRVSCGAAIMTGDTVTVCARRGYLKRGELPNGTTGVVVGFESVPSPFTAGERIVLAEVDFGHLGTHKVTTNVLSKTFGRMGCPAPPLSFREFREESDRIRRRTRAELDAVTYSRDAISSEKARAMAKAHRDLDDAYDRLANALDALREVEAR